MVKAVLERPPGADDEDEDAEDVGENIFLPAERQLGEAAGMVQASVTDLLNNVCNSLRSGGKASMQATVPFSWFSLAAGLYDVDVTIKVAAKPAKPRKK
jgi:hypothetical protein